MKATAEITSSPVRRGPVYCTPSCGADCLYADYAAAKLDAERLATALGAGWRARVWDNLGWHWSVYFGRNPLGISMSNHGASDYSLIVNGAVGSFVIHGRSPRRLLMRARARVIEDAQRVAAAAGAFPL